MSWELYNCIFPVCICLLVFFLLICRNSLYVKKGVFQICGTQVRVFFSIFSCNDY